MEQAISLMPKSSRPNANGKRYDTPKDIGVKWQMDVKFVPMVCYSGKYEKRFYQYTIIEEASRKRFIFLYLFVSHH